MSGPETASAEKTIKCDPVCQIFVNGNGKQTSYTLTNFASLYAPQEARPCRYTVTLFDETGTEAARTGLSIPAFGTVEFKPASEFSGALPEMGLISVEFDETDATGYEHLGMLRPYFYAMYHDADMHSVAVVHPQTTFLETAPSGKTWRSTLIVATADIEALEIYQVNPVSEERQTSVAVCDLDGATLASSEASMGPRSVRRILWRSDEFSDREFVALSSGAMTAPNAKPLLFQNKKCGFTAGHS